MGGEAQIRTEMSETVYNTVTDFEVVGVDYSYPTGRIYIHQGILYTHIDILVWYEKATSGTGAPNNPGVSTASSWEEYTTHSYKWHPLGFYRHEQRNITMESVVV